MLKISDLSQEGDRVVIKTAIKKGFTLIELPVVIAIIAEPRKPTLTGFWTQLPPNNGVLRLEYVWFCLRTRLAGLQAADRQEIARTITGDKFQQMKIKVT